MTTISNGHRHTRNGFKRCSVASRSAGGGQYSGGFLTIRHRDAYQRRPDLPCTSPYILQLRLRLHGLGVMIAAPCDGGGYCAVLDTR